MTSILLRPSRCRAGLTRLGKTLGPALLLALAALALSGPRADGAVAPPGLFQMPLSQIPVPEPPNLFQFVKNKPAAIRLGKAFFWDMQTGSDGVQSCATCHFEAGVDKRRKNTLNPGSRAGDTTFQVRGPNQTLLDSDFPFHLRQVPDIQASAILRDSNDVVGSQGVKLASFQGITLGSAVDNTSPLADPIFQDAGANVRQVTARNAPTMINAVFNFHNFWDGRAHFIFNGSTPFGPMDGSAGAWFAVGTPPALARQPVSIESASLASQAVGPPLDTTEMSAVGRTFPDLARKLLSLTPLGRQAVHPADSVLGPLSRAIVLPGGKLGGGNGLNTSYRNMIQAAFLDNLTSTTLLTPDGSTQMEANFSLFWGLAIQLYEATLVSGQTPFDALLGGDPNALTAQQVEGMNLFFGGTGRCSACHSGTELTGASVAAAAFVTNIGNGAVEQMVAGGRNAIYDQGFNSTAERRTSEDIGRGGKAPLVNPLNGQLTPLDYAAQAELQAIGLLPFPTVVLTPALPVGFPVANAGGFKVPGLRNVELTAPYFHDGGVLTLEDTVRFYIRGGNFPVHGDSPNLDPGIAEIPLMQNSPAQVAAMVAFLQSLTDQRVRNQSAPFDHPELFIPEGDPEVLTRIPPRDADGVPAPAIAVTLDPFAPTINQATLALSGTREAGATVQVQVNLGSPVATAGPTPTTWTCAIGGLTEGANTLTLLASDSTGALGTLTAPVTVRTALPALSLDPVPPAILGSTLALSGTVDPGVVPLITTSSASGAVPVLMSGSHWTAQLTGLATGPCAITVIARDPAGNVSSRSAAVNVVIGDGILGGTAAASDADAFRALRLALGVLNPGAQDLLHGDVAPAGAPDGRIDLADALRILRKAAGSVTF